MSKNSGVAVLVILASVRPSRRADEVLHWWSAATEATAQSTGATLELADLRHWNLPFGHEVETPNTGVYELDSTRRWAAQVDAADAFVVITSEHNHSLPASLKNAFDLVGPEWGGKPVAWVSYGNTSAGTRALLAAKQVASTLGLHSVGPDVSIRLSELEAPGRPAVAAREGSAASALRSLVQHAYALRPMRRSPLAIASLPAAYVAHRGGPDDAGELLTLQRACWVDEALANRTVDIAALNEDLPTVATALARPDSVVVRQGGRLVASVQAWHEGTTWWIGRLMVAPDHRRRGLARALLRYAAQLAPVGTRRIRLNTGAASQTNLALYAAEGFSVEGDSGPGVALLAKPVAGLAAAKS
jgi:NAD(P)H-dependent FMN reductase/GNAT superfamily N-acetyltransferase